MSSVRHRWTKSNLPSCYGRPRACSRICHVFGRRRRRAASGQSRFAPQFHMQYPCFQRRLGGPSRKNRASLLRQFIWEPSPSICESESSRCPSGSRCVDIQYWKFIHQVPAFVIRLTKYYSMFSSQGNCKGDHRSQRLEVQDIDIE